MKYGDQNAVDCKKVTMWAPVFEDARQPNDGSIPIWSVSDSVFRTKGNALSAKHDTCVVVAAVAVEVELK